jgi:hypothetical protein
MITSDDCICDVDEDCCYEEECPYCNELDQEEHCPCCPCDDCLEEEGQPDIPFWTFDHESR